VPQLVRKDPEPFVEIHPDDAVENDVQDGEWVYLVGRRGRCYARARITEAIRRGLLFTPFHWGDLFHAETNANYVTNPAFDPVSKQPELKFCAVRIEVDDVQRQTTV
jgi:anaerobic selenocysteine-containing dehydrogenase